VRAGLLNAQLLRTAWHAGVWAFAYAVIAVFMTVLTLRFGPDPHLPHTHYIGCVIPGALWAGCILVSVLSCYTTDYIRRVLHKTARAAGAAASRVD
jgi:hypothetical protein